MPRLVRAIRSTRWAFPAALMLIGAFCGFASGIANADPTVSTLHRFRGNHDGTFPQGGLVMDAAGNLYGTAAFGANTGCSPSVGCGMVFQLSPPAQGQTAWTETVLHRFNGAPDGASPFAELTLDPATGTLYGTTEIGGLVGVDFGTVFKLTPPAPGGTRWTETVIHRFEGGGNDGIVPESGLVLDQAGALYGATTIGGNQSDAGVIFKLTPPRQGRVLWTETILHRFQGGKDGSNPYSTLIFDSAKNLYGTTYAGGNGTTCPDANWPGCGTVFKLNANGFHTVLHSFAGGIDGAHPYAGLVADPSGNLYGTTYEGGTGNGTVFALTPPDQGKTAWTYRQIHRFQGNAKGDASFPSASLTIDAGGNLYGTSFAGGTANAGTVFKLTPPVEPQKPWTETVLHSFFPDTDGEAPTSALIADGKGNFYSTIRGQPATGCPEFSCGTVFELVP